MSVYLTDYEKRCNISTLSSQNLICHDEVINCSDPLWGKSMTSDSLRQAERNRKRLREQLASKQDAWVTAAPEEKMRIQQGIDDHKQLIKRADEEYWEILADESSEVQITDAESEVIVAEIVSQAEKLSNSQDYSEEVLDWLQKIHKELTESGVPAAAKLKGVVSSIPPFVGISYEAELDTEVFLRKNFPTFTKWVRGLKKKF